MKENFNKKKQKNIVIVVENEFIVFFDIEIDIEIDIGKEKKLSKLNEKRERKF